MSARCIYCLGPSDDAKGVAHVCPEAIVRNTTVLPRGAECDRCNSALGDVDREVAQYPAIALPIQFLALPGKKNKPRHVVGNFDRASNPGWITIPCEAPTPGTAADGTRTTTWRTTVDPSLDLWKVSRGLHHMAFNVLAHWKGVEHAHRGEFDAVRKYVREPKGRSEHWPFIQVSHPMARIRNRVHVAVCEAPFGDVVCLRIFNSDFWVDVRNTGQLIPWARENLPTHAHIVDASFPVPKPDPPGSPLYRIRIEAN